MPFSVVSSKSIKKCRVFFNFILFWACFLLSPFTYAEIEYWETASSNYLTGKTPSFDSAFCESCHTPIYNEALKITTPIVVPFGQNSASLTLEGFDLGNTDWSSLQYRIESNTPVLINDVRPGGSGSVDPVDITGLSSPVQLRYCLVDADVDTDIEDNTRTWNCQEIEITRETKPPEITSQNPGDQDVVLNGSSYDFMVSVDGDPLPAVEVSSSSPQTVSVTDNTGGSYSLKGLAIGESTITISAKDSKDREASSQSFLVTVKLSLAIPGPINPGPVIPGGPIIGSNPPIEIINPTVAFDVVVPDPVEMLATEERSIPFTVNDNNPESLTFDISSSDMSVATASVTEGDIVAGIRGSDTLLINAKNEGFATVVLQVTNSLNGTASLSVNVEVGKENTAPQAKPDSIIVTADDRIRLLDVLGNDFDGEKSVLSIVLGGDRSTLGNALSIDAGKVKYELTDALVAVDSFNYRAKDVDGLQSDAVTVTLTPSDKDGDNVIDAKDNCPELDNPDQANMDSDSKGDLCDEDPDGDGIAGISGAPFVSGKALVDEKCLRCHSTGSSGAPKFGDKVAWDSRIAAVGGDPANLLDSVVNGKLPLMPAFGAEESYQRLLQAILYLSGREVAPGDENVVTVSDIDSDTIPDGLDNCPEVPNTLQINSDNAPAGDACEPSADRDEDGFPFSIDDDDGNASRLIATLPTVTNSTVFSSSGNLKLGRVATAVAQSVDYAQASIVLSEAEFARGVSQVFPGVTVGADSSYSSLMGIINIVATSTAGISEFIIHLSSNLPLEPELRVFDTRSGLWSDFQTGDAGQLDSAPATDSGCPNRESANYQSGLIAGLSCIRVRFKDGGLNDADGFADNQAELVVNIAGGRAIGDGSPSTVDISPSKSSGGASSPWFLLLLFFIAACCNGLLQRPRG